MPSTSFVLMHASMARAPEFAMVLASKMAANALEARDAAKLRRWSRSYVELRAVFGDPPD